jgi:hypothetical protein
MALLRTAASGRAEAHGGGDAGRARISAGGRQRFRRASAVNVQNKLVRKGGPVRPETEARSADGRVPEALFRPTTGGEAEMSWCGRGDSCPKTEARSADNRVPEALFRPTTGGEAEMSWCGRGDSNPHALASASPSSWCVCQFRHFRRQLRTTGPRGVPPSTAANRSSAVATCRARPAAASRRPPGPRCRPPPIQGLAGHRPPESAITR